MWKEGTLLPAILLLKVSIMGCPFCGSSVQCLIPEDMIKGSHRSDSLTGRKPLKQKFRCANCNAVVVKKRRYKAADVALTGY
jgi:transcription elongation factor Elf1